MSRYDEIKELINQKIVPFNDRQLITGDGLNTTLNAMVDALGDEDELILTVRYDAETYPVIQPTAYDSSTGVFTSAEPLPSWVADSGTTKVIPFVIDPAKTRKAFRQTGGWSCGLTKVDSTHFKVSEGSVPADVDCTAFQFCASTNNVNAVFNVSNTEREVFKVEWWNLNSVSKGSGNNQLELNFNSAPTSNQGYGFNANPELNAESAALHRTIADRGYFIFAHTPNEAKYEVLEGYQSAVLAWDGSNAELRTFSAPFSIRKGTKIDVWGGARPTAFHLTGGRGGSDLYITPLSTLKIYKLKHYKE